MYDQSEVQAKDIPEIDFTDDVKALIMFRGLEYGEKIIGQTFKSYQKF